MSFLWYSPTKALPLSPNAKNIPHGIDLVKNIHLSLCYKMFQYIGILDYMHADGS